MIILNTRLRFFTFSKSMLCINFLLKFGFFQIEKLIDLSITSFSNSLIFFKEILVLKSFTLIFFAVHSYPFLNLKIMLEFKS